MQSVPVGAKAGSWLPAPRASCCLALKPQGKRELHCGLLHVLASYLGSHLPLNAQGTPNGRTLGPDFHYYDSVQKLSEIYVSPLQRCACPLTTIALFLPFFKHRIRFGQV